MSTLHAPAPYRLTPIGWIVANEHAPVDYVPTDLTDTLKVTDTITGKSFTCTPGSFMQAAEQLPTPWFNEWHNVRELQELLTTNPTDPRIEDLCWLLCVEIAPVEVNQ
ncbi:hypothetical protein YH66_04335 [[Brevibacterium] flavum]|uniref:Uncharacterized protein n=1 Tax=[Brevibacterium] flavum TaxID=92706 RepID=A0A0F6SQU9_9CORY|nr:MULTISPECIES: hypothetical protein [Corynebacterium]AKF26839.1 hypothetical protein YH66_04335 [[Brevibacterium] flavum]ANE07659.1 hypothetical protein A3654_04310 [Corynebacterium glutamicum]AST20075.1 hypothetical protein CEY17_04375 [Corynebacterium glutamicum ATCC 14067]KEI22545.1 hypothetical protein KIQ_008135 [Corynebacterium glutamicum ATCC 14067]KIH74420.1 hypothetical protein SD36_04400 [Corynebacterium glutamicum]